MGYSWAIRGLFMGFVGFVGFVGVLWAFLGLCGLLMGYIHLMHDIYPISNSPQFSLDM